MVDGAVWAFEGVAPHADVRGEAVIAPGSIDNMLLVEGKLHDFAAGFAGHGLVSVLVSFGVVPMRSINAAAGCLSTGAHGNFRDRTGIRRTRKRVWG